MADSAEQQNEHKVTAEQPSQERSNNYKMNGVIGTIEAFNFDEDNFTEYLERFEYIFTVNKIAEDQMKIALVMSMAGKEFHTKVTSLIMPRKPAQFKYDELMTELKKHFSPKTNLRYERYKFMSRKFESHETLSDFIVDLKFLADSCDYKDFLDHVLCDKLIWSLRDSSMQKRLLDEPITKSFSEICSIALSMEMVARNVEEMRGDRNRNILQLEAKQLNKTFHKYAKGASTSKDYNNLRVTRRRSSADSRSYKSNDRSEDRADRVQCYRCQRYGHVSRDCQYDRRKPYVRPREKSGGYQRYNSNPKRHFGKSKINQVDENEEYDSPEGRQDDVLSLDAESLDESDVFLNNLSMGKKKGKSFDCRPHVAKLNIENYKILMEVDSGASYSVISWSFYERYFKDILLEECFVPLSVISGSQLRVMGQIGVKVQVSDSVYFLDLIVIDTNAKFLPLLGRDWLNVLLPDWKTRLTINKINENLEGEFSLEKLKQKFPKVFDEDYTEAIKDMWRI